MSFQRLIYIIITFIFFSHCTLEHTQCYSKMNLSCLNMKTFNLSYNNWPTTITHIAHFAIFRLQPIKNKTLIYLNVTKKNLCQNTYCELNNLFAFLFCLLHEIHSTWVKTNAILVFQVHFPSHLSAQHRSTSYSSLHCIQMRREPMATHWSLPSS